MSGGVPPRPPGEARAWGWAAHLRDGGTVPWVSWQEEGAPLGRVVPGAQQLELLRRINLTGRPSAALADRVLGATAPGRGSPDFQLVGATWDTGFGPRPVDPVDLPAAELLRLAAGLLAEDLRAVPRPAAPPPRRRARWRRRYRLVGDPQLAGAVRRSLTATGTPLGGRRAHVLALGAGLERMLGDAWVARCFESRTLPWEAWVAHWRHRTRLPPRIDLPRVAEAWSARLGPRRVHVVLDEAALPRLLRTDLPRWAGGIAADAAELARTLTPVLDMRMPPGDRARVLRQVLRPRVVDAPGPPPEVPPEHRDWVREEAHRMQQALVRSRYAVHGSPDVVLADLPGGGPPSAAGALALAIRLVLAGPRGGAEEEVPG